MDTQLHDAFENGYSYLRYRQMLTDLLAEGKTTGEDQSEGMIAYAELNQSRMNRGDKTVKISEEVADTLRNLNHTEKWLVITEGWCGDAAQITPVLHAMETIAPNIEMRLVLRDENPEIMDRFLTNGTRSIPKLVRLDGENYEVISDWGPRPAAMQEIVAEWKKTPEVPKSEMYQKLHGAYAKDRGKEVIREIIELLNQTELVAV